MGNYITTADVQQRVGVTRLAQLINDPANYATILGDVVTRAESRVDAYLAVRYTVPVASTGLIEDLSLTVAEYDLYRRGSGGDVPAKIRQAYEDAISDLRAIADGTMGAGGTAEPTTSTSTGDFVVDSDTPLFDADSLEDAVW